MPSQIFVSHSSKDNDLVRDLVENLKNHRELQDFNFWVDFDELEIADTWQKEIAEAIEKSIAILVVCTEYSNASAWVTFEWSYAMGLRKPIIPIIYNFTNLHDLLVSRQGVNFTGATRPLQRLVEKLKKLTLSPTNPLVEIMYELFTGEDEPKLYDALALLRKKDFISPQEYMQVNTWYLECRKRQNLKKASQQSVAIEGTESQPLNKSPSSHKKRIRRNAKPKPTNNT